MIETGTFQYRKVGRDVAFTSDGRFFVTERDGMPSLVETRLDYVWNRYDLEGGQMTAATFSPDDEKLYIATSDYRIFEFNSELPESGTEVWEVYP